MEYGAISAINPGAILRYLSEFEKIGGENHGMVIIKDGKVVFENYAYPYRADLPHSMFSVTKSLVSTAVGFAVQEGLLTLDTLILPYFEDLPHPKSAEWETLTLEKLLTMQSDKEFTFLQDMTGDYAKIFMKAPFRRKKGFLYSNNDAYMVSALLQKVTGEDVRSYLTPRLFEPLGIKVPFWERNEQGVCIGGTGVYLTTMDMAKICLCYLNGGQYEGKQVIPAFWAREIAEKKSTPSSIHSADGYSYFFWLEKGTVRMEGLFGQFGVMIPEHNAVVAVTGMYPGDGMTTKMLLSVLLPTLFEPAEKGSEEALNKYIRQRDGRAKPIVGKRNAHLEERAQKSIYIRADLVTDLNRYFGKQTNGLIPSSVSSSFVQRPKDSFNKINFEFFSDRCRISWTEGEERVTFDAGMNGEPCLTKTTLAGTEYTVWGYAYWKWKRLFVTVKPLNTVASKTYCFHFLPYGMDLMTSAKPDFRDFVAVNAVAGGAIPVLRGMESPVENIMRLMLTPVGKTPVLFAEELKK